jgi:hydroxylamine reductase
MFCFQCEQTQHGTGCTKVGVCGKTPRVAAMQDALIHAAKLLGFYAHKLREMKAPDNAEWNRLTLYALFTTLTNVNFDEARFGELVPKVVAMAEAARGKR